ncbi:MAG: hypothetical protein ACXVJM_20805, partial [Mucilaginibacter sp.]
MVGVDKAVTAIEDILRSWFSEKAFIKASRIQFYPLLDAEKILIADAVISRQKEFSTGRWLARQGLQQFGLPIEPIKMGKLRNPLWPDSL